MKMILNEQSAVFPLETADDAKRVMEIFLETYSLVRKRIHDDQLILDKDYNSIQLAQGYCILQWRNDSTVDKELRRLFFSILNRSAVYDKFAFDEYGFLPDPGKKRCYIAHIGRKLPTVRFH